MCVLGGGGGGGVRKMNNQNETIKRDIIVSVIIIIIDRFYIALFSALEQTHCARMWFYMSE